MARAPVRGAAFQSLRRVRAPNLAANVAKAGLLGKPNARKVTMSAKGSEIGIAWRARPRAARALALGARRRRHAVAGACRAHLASLRNGVTSHREGIGSAIARSNVSAISPVERGRRRLSTVSGAFAVSASARSAWPKALGLEPAQHQGGVGAAEAERVGKRGVDPALLRLVRHQVDGASRPRGCRD